MDRLKAKQIEDVLDTSSEQDVNATKNFFAPQVFMGGAQHVIIAAGYIYWCANPDILDEPGNSRISVLGGIMQRESFDGVNWNIHV